MTCSECGKTALRLGTKNRAYCKAHESMAWDQARDDSKKKSALNDMLQHEWIETKKFESRVRAV